MIKEVGDNSIEYVYGSEGIIGIIIDNNGTKENYLFRKNVFGDVTHIYNESGALVGKYRYTAFGECTIEVGENGIASINPIRYRGYYYDDETGLYYLKSRYYDPVLGRFMTIDDISYLDPETINGLNLYAYCGNNPVMYTDPYGTTKWWEWLIAGALIVGCIVGAVFTGGTSLVGAAFIGAAIGGGVSIVTQAITTGELNWGQFALDMGMGAISGAIGASHITRLGATIVGGALGGVSNVVSQLISGKGIDEINWLKVGISAGIGALASFIGGAGARNTLASNAAPKVQKAISSVNKVLARQTSGYYSSARYAQTALTNVANRLGRALAVQQAKTMAWALTWLGIGSAGFNFIDGFIGFFVSGW